MPAKGAVEKAGIGLTNVAPTPLEAADASKLLLGKVLSDENILAAAKLAAAKSQPSADRRGSVEYKRQMTRVLCARALRAALERAKGGY